MRIKWLKAALQNMRDIAEYIAADNPKAAFALVGKIKRASDYLISQPYMGRAGRVRGTRELMIVGTSYFLVYRVQPKAIDILRVLHQARTWPES